MKSKDTVRLDPQAPWHTYAEVASYLGISLRSFYRLLELQDGPRVSRLTPRKPVILKADLDAWVKGRSHPRKRNRSNPNGAVPAPLA